MAADLGDCRQNFPENLAGDLLRESDPLYFCPKSWMQLLDGDMLELRCVYDSWHDGG